MTKVQIWLVALSLFGGCSSELPPVGDRGSSPTDTIHAGDDVAVEGLGTTDTSAADQRVIDRGNDAPLGDLGPDATCPGDRDCDGDPDASDCEPDNEAVFNGQQERCNGVDDNCVGGVDEADALDCLTYYRDEDGDGFGLASDSACLCATTGLYRAKKAGDCYDKNKAARPGLDPKLYFAKHRGDGSFDFDCDKRVLPEVLVTNARCSPAPFCKALLLGFTGPVGCGKSGTYLTSCTSSGLAKCTRKQGPRVQRCR